MTFYQTIRQATEALCEPLAEEDCIVQSMPNCSPAKWHLAHTSWFLDYPKLQIQAQVGNYTTGLGKVERAQDGTLLVLFLGSNIGNYAPPEALQLLSAVRQSLRSGELLLLGADLKKAPAIMEAAYDDALGVTAPFNRNLLVRINRELEADFDLKKFAHRATYNSEADRIEMHLVSQVAQKVHLRGLNLVIQFQAGETIHTENSRKFDAVQ